MYYNGLYPRSSVFNFSSYFKLIARDILDAKINLSYSLHNQLKTLSRSALKPCFVLLSLDLYLSILDTASDASLSYFKKSKAKTPSSIFILFFLNWNKWRLNTTVHEDDEVKLFLKEPDFFKDRPDLIQNFLRSRPVISRKA